MCKHLYSSIRTCQIWLLNYITVTEHSPFYTVTKFESEHNYIPKNLPDACRVYKIIRIITMHLVYNY